MTLVETILILQPTIGALVPIVMNLIAWALRKNHPKAAAAVDRWSPIALRLGMSKTAKELQDNFIEAVHEVTTTPKSSSTVTTPSGDVVAIDLGPKSQATTALDAAPKPGSPPSGLLVIVVYMAIALVGCSAPARQIEAEVATGIAMGANASLPSLVSLEDREGRDEIAVAQTRPEAESRLDAVRERWAPIWQGWKTFSIAHEAWAEALENGGDTTAALAALKKAFCGLVKVWPKSLALPAVPFAVSAVCPKELS